MYQIFGWNNFLCYYYCYYWFFWVVSRCWHWSLMIVNVFFHCFTHDHWKYTNVLECFTIGRFTVKPESITNLRCFKKNESEFLFLKVFSVTVNFVSQVSWCLFVCTCTLQVHKLKGKCKTLQNDMFDDKRNEDTGPGQEEMLN